MLFFFSDYREMPELDRYEEVGIDNGDYEPMAIDERRAAERELDQNQVMRDRSKARAPDGTHVLDKVTWQAISPKNLDEDFEILPHLSRSA